MNKDRHYCVSSHQMSKYEVCWKFKVDNSTTSCNTHLKETSFEGQYEDLLKLKARSRAV